MNCEKTFSNLRSVRHARGVGGIIAHTLIDYNIYPDVNQALVFVIKVLKSICTVSSLKTIKNSINCL